MSTAPTLNRIMAFFPEGNEALPTDSEQRLLVKWNTVLVEQNGAVGDVPYPEGTNPLPTDSPERSTKKINAIYAAL